MNGEFLSIAVFFLAFAVVAGAISRVNRNRRVTGKATIGFTFRGTALFWSDADAAENVAYAWPVVVWICLGVAVVMLAVALAT